MQFETHDHPARRLLLVSVILSILCAGLIGLNEARQSLAGIAFTNSIAVGGDGRDAAPSAFSVPEMRSTETLGEAHRTAQEKTEWQRAFEERMGQRFTPAVPPWVHRGESDRPGERTGWQGESQPPGLMKVQRTAQSIAGEALQRIGVMLQERDLPLQSRARVQQVITDLAALIGSEGVEKERVRSLIEEAKAAFHGASSVAVEEGPSQSMAHHPKLAAMAAAMQEVIGLIRERLSQSSADEQALTTLQAGIAQSSEEVRARCVGSPDRGGDTPADGCKATLAKVIALMKDGRARIGRYVESLPSDEREALGTAIRAIIETHMSGLDARPSSSPMPHPSSLVPRS
jgi:DNA gyrase/topoisomerase IV subunit A